MSSQIPTRRTTRVTRLQDENAVKGRQPATRGAAKSGVAATAAGSSKPSGNTALDINTQNKRKREALGEVTNNNKNKNIPRGISKDTKLNKPHVLITKPPPRTAVQAPVRKTRASTAASAKDDQVPEAREDDREDDAMIVDEPAAAQPLQRVSRKLTTRTATTVTTSSVVATATRRSTLTKRPSAAISTQDAHPVPTKVEEQVDDADHRVAKRRRTSSEAGDEDIVEVEVETNAPGVDNGPVLETKLALEEEEEEVTGWDDLDKDDFDDPLMVSEYVVEIFKYLRECEDQTLANPDYIQHQKELRWSHRGIMMDFLIGLHSQFRLCQETLYLAANIIDRFLSMRVVSLLKLQLVGLASLFIAAKYEEIVAPSAQHYLKIARVEDEIKEDDMLKAERYILKTLDWTISLYPQPMNWLRRISKADDYDPHVRTVAKFFLEIHVVERRLLGVKPSLLAAASVWLARIVLNQFEWTPNLAHYSGYSEKKIIPVANVLLNYCLRTEQHENFLQKYASRKFSKASIYVNDWVTTRWAIGEKVLLADELPFIKALALEAHQGVR